MIEKMNPLSINCVQKALEGQSEGSSDFDLNDGFELPTGRKLRPAAVLVPLIETDDALHLILTKRSSALKHHPGQIAFPGGKVDEGDDDVLPPEKDEKVGESIVEPSPMVQHYPVQEAELTKTEVAHTRCRVALLTYDANTNVGLLDHAHVIAPVADGQHD